MPRKLNEKLFEAADFEILDEMRDANLAPRGHLSGLPANWPARDRRRP